MKFNEILKKYWFLGLVAILLLVFVGAYGASSIKNKPETVKTLQNEGKDVVYTLDGENYYYADDLYDGLYESLGGSLGFYSYYHKLVDEGVETTEELSTYAANAANNILAQQGEETVKAQMLQAGFNGVEDLTDYCLFNLKLQQLVTDIYLNEADKYTQPVVDKENPRFVQHILISVADVEEVTDKDGNVTHVCHPTKEEQKKLDDCLAELAKDNKAFGEIAMNYSDDPGSAESGGALMNQDGTKKVVCESNKTMYVPEFADACMQAKDGVITDPVQTQYGYHIIRVETPSLEDLVNDQEFFSYIEANDPNLVLKVLIERTGDKGFEILDENVKAQLNNYLEAE